MWEKRLNKGFGEYNRDWRKHLGRAAYGSALLFHMCLMAFPSDFSADWSSTALNMDGSEAV